MTNKPNISKAPNITPIDIQQYERYLPSAFDNGLSILQKINKVIQQLNTIGKVTNDIVGQWNDLIEWIIGQGLTSTVEEIIDRKIADGSFDVLFQSIVGLLENLETEHKETVVGAINEVNEMAVKSKTDIGDITELTTIDKSNIVNAMNEMVNDILINRQAPTTIGEATGYGTISGFRVRQQAVPSMAVEVGQTGTPNIVHMPSGIRYVIPNATVAVDDAHSTMKRIDLIHVNQNGSISIVKGVESENPVAPVVTGESVPLAHINIVANDTSINNSDIVDIRPLKNLNTLVTERKENLVVAVNELHQDILSLGGTLDTLIENVITDINQSIADLALEVTQNKNHIGVIDELISVDKTSLVSAINEIINDIGQLVSLETQEKTDVVNAINETLSQVKTNIQNIGDLSLLTNVDNSNLVNAILELKSLITTNTNNVGLLDRLPTDTKASIVDSILEIWDSVELANSSVWDEIKKIQTDIGNKTELPTDDKTSLVNAMKEIVRNTGSLVMLNTESKTSLVNAINEVDGNTDKNSKDLEQRSVNAKTFGAKGDGLTNDTQAINNAIDYLKSIGGGVLYFPAGVYNIHTTILKPAKVSFKGSGMLTTVLRWHGENASSVISTKNESLHGTFIEDMHITNGTSLSNVNGILGGSTLEIYNSAIGTFKNLFFSNLKTGIIGNAEPTGVGIFDCLFENIWVASCSVGLHLHGSGNVITHPRIVLCDVGVMYDYLNAESYASAQMIGGVFVQNNYDLSVPKVLGMRPSSFIGTWFEQAVYGIINIPNLNTRIMSMTFQNCMLNTNSTIDLISFYGAVGSITIDTCTIAQSINGPKNIVQPVSSQSKLSVRNTFVINTDGSTEILDDVENTQKKTYVKVSKSIQQTITKGAFTKVTFETPLNDELVEYSHVENWFAPHNDGVYGVTCTLQMINMVEELSQSNRIQMVVYLNDVLTDKIGDLYKIASETTNFAVTGTTFMKMKKGDRLQIFLMVDKDVEVVSSNASSFLKIARMF